MCIGEAGLDTIGASERESLRVTADSAFPAHRFGVHANEEKIFWIVLEPSAIRPTCCASPSAASRPASW